VRIFVPTRVKAFTRTRTLLVQIKKTLIAQIRNRKSCRTLRAVKGSNKDEKICRENYERKNLIDEEKLVGHRGNMHSHTLFIALHATCLQHKSRLSRSEFRVCRETNKWQVKQMQITSGMRPISAIDFTARGDAFQEIQAEVLRLPSLRNYNRGEASATKCEPVCRRQGRTSQEEDNGAEKDR